MKGTLLKMKAELKKGEAFYKLPIGSEEISLNNYIGKKIQIKFTQNIFCIATGEKIKKTYNNGYSYKAFISLARCDTCQIKPELCHYHKGTCREPEWGEKHCFIPHYVYFSVSSHLKVGITRHTNIPSRWIDQGAELALPIVKVPDRLSSGIVEVELKKEFRDKTDWRKMLKGEKVDQELDLERTREHLYETYGDLFDDVNAEDLEESVTEIRYPLESPPPKIKSLSLDINDKINEELLGIKGQYLVFPSGVFNVRRHQGYEIDFEA